MRTYRALLCLGSTSRIEIVDAATASEARKRIMRRLTPDARRTLRTVDVTRNTLSLL